MTTPRTSLLTEDEMTYFNGKYRSFKRVMLNPRSLLKEIQFYLDNLVKSFRTIVYAAKLEYSEVNRKKIDNCTAYMKTVENVIIRFIIGGDDLEKIFSEKSGKLDIKPAVDFFNLWAFNEEFD